MCTPPTPTHCLPLPSSIGQYLYLTGKVGPATAAQGINSSSGGLQTREGLDLDTRVTRTSFWSFSSQTKQKKSQPHSVLPIAKIKRLEHDPHANNANSNYSPPPPLSRVKGTVPSVVGRQQNSQFSGHREMMPLPRHVSTSQVAKKSTFATELLPNQLGRVAAVTLDRGG